MPRRKKRKPTPKAPRQTYSHAQPPPSSFRRFNALTFSKCAFCDLRACGRSTNYEGCQPATVAVCNEHMFAQMLGIANRRQLERERDGAL